MSVIAIDVSHWDTIPDPQAVKDAGVLAILAKASEGLAYIDDKYVRYRRAFTDLGLKWGAYHFFHGSTAEADFFLRCANLGNDDVAALDWENLPNGGSPTAAEARGWLERVEAKLGRKAVVYSGNVAKERIQGHDPFFAAHRLWLAQYSVRWSCQASWTYPWLWQYSETGHVPGVAGHCDVNTIVQGTPEQFIASWAGETPAPTPAPTPTPPQPEPTPAPPSYVGTASWYDDHTNADGSPVRPSDMTVAVRQYGPLDKFGQLLKITRTDNNKSAIAKVTDHGGPALSGNRIIDCRPALALALGFGPAFGRQDQGIVPVRIEKIDPMEALGV